MFDEITNEVLAERLENLITINSKEHLELLGQQKKTNGAISSLKIWRGIITGGLIVLSSIVIPMALMVFGKFLEK